MNEDAQDPTSLIISTERAALDRWGKGDPSGFLEICAPDVVYFDPFLEKRLDGLHGLTAYYERIRGQVAIDRYDLINPRVQVAGSAAVLTFNLVSYGGNENAFRWNCTEVYRQNESGVWQIIQTHWSYTGGLRGTPRASLDNAFGYQGDKMHLPVADLDSAVPFYEQTLGFRVISRNDDGQRSVVLARDAVEIGLAESGGDSSQDGCAFHVTNLRALFDEFKANGLQKELANFDTEKHGDDSWQVFYVVAPDGLCYWFGERQAR